MCEASRTSLGECIERLGECIEQAPRAIPALLVMTAGIFFSPVNNQLALSKRCSARGHGRRDLLQGAAYNGSGLVSNAPPEAKSKQFGGGERPISNSTAAVEKKKEEEEEDSRPFAVRNGSI